LLVVRTSSVGVEALGNDVSILDKLCKYI